MVALGDTLKPGDRVQLDDGRAVKVEEEKSALQVLLYNKPLGTVCTRSDEEGRSTIFDKLPRVRSGRWINVGRLDINTTGLLLLTNNGELVHRLTHPSYTIDREYAVRVYGNVDSTMLKSLRAGVEIDSEILAFNDIVPGEGNGANKWFYCLVQSGRNRAVRRLWESQDVSVSRLMRVRFGNIMLPTDLRVGQHLELGKPLVSELCNLVGLDGNGMDKAS
jgi:23S rRNA pseudouridine2605 synthase